MTKHSSQDEFAIPPEEGKTLQALERNDCRWPFGDPRHGDFYFCGKKRMAGHPYCEFHMRRAFQPARPRDYGRH